MRVENGLKMEVKQKIYKREFNKVSGKFPNSTQGFKNEGGGPSVNSTPSTPT